MVSWAFVCLRARRAVTACERGFPRVWGGRSALVSNENEAGLPGWGPGLVGGVRALARLVRSAVDDRPRSIVLQSQEDDFALVHGFQ